MNIVLRLAKKLSIVKMPALVGAIIVRVELRKLDSSSKLSSNELEHATIIRKNNRSWRILVYDTDVSGTVYAMVATMLLRDMKYQNTMEPRVIKHNNKANIDNKCYTLKIWRSFSVSDMSKYLDYTGDTNIIHQGKNAIIPGLMLIAYLFEDNLLMLSTGIEVRFIRPVKVSSNLSYNKYDDKIYIYCDSLSVLEIRAINDK